MSGIIAYECCYIASNVCQLSSYPKQTPAINAGYYNLLTPHLFLYMHSWESVKSELWAMRQFWWNEMLSVPSWGWINNSLWKEELLTFFGCKHINNDPIRDIYCQDDFVELMPLCLLLPVTSISPPPLCLEDSWNIVNSLAMLDWALSKLAKRSNQIKPGFKFIQFAA